MSVVTKRKLPPGEKKKVKDKKQNKLHPGKKQKVKVKDEDDEDDDDEDYEDYEEDDEDEDDEDDELEEEVQLEEDEVKQLVKDYKKSSIMDSIMDLFKVFFKEDPKIITEKQYEQISSFFKQDKQAIRLLDIKQLENTIIKPEKIYKNTRLSDKTIQIQMLKELKNKIPENLFITEEFFDIHINGRFFKKDSPIEISEYNKHLIIDLIHTKTKTQFIFKIAYNYKNHGHIYLIHYDRNSNTFTIIDTAAVHGEYKYLDPSQNYEEDDCKNIHKSTAFIMSRISEILYFDSMSRTSKIIPTFSCNLLCFPNIQGPEVPVFKISGLCQIWALFFIYYYLVGFNGKEGLEALKEIFLFFKKITESTIYTKILTVWCYIHFNFNRSDKVRFVFKPKKSKTKKSKPKKSKPKKSPKTKKSNTKKSPKTKKSKTKKSPKPKKSKTKKY